MKNFKKGIMKATDELWRAKVSPRINRSQFKMLTLSLRRVLAFGKKNAISPIVSMMLVLGKLIKIRRTQRVFKNELQGIPASVMSR
jgi:hypothetical protein